jgi:hypothetical protein
MQKKTIQFWGVALAAIGLFPMAGACAKEKTTVLAVMEADQPYGVLRTVDGRMFLGVRDARADESGLTFRHQGGAAKVARQQLSEADLKRFSVPEVVAKAVPAANAGEPLAWEGPNPAAITVPPLVFTYRVRTILPVSAPSASCEIQSCAGALSHTYWPSHWARPHYGLAYPLFPCRQLAERDFLLTTGILPRPRGVWPWRLR